MVWCTNINTEALLCTLVHTSVKSVLTQSRGSCVTRRVWRRGVNTGASNTRINYQTLVTLIILTKQERYEQLVVAAGWTIYDRLVRRKRKLVQQPLVGRQYFARYNSFHRTRGREVKSPGRKYGETVQGRGGVMLIISRSRDGEEWIVEYLFAHRYHQPWWRTTRR